MIRFLIFSALILAVKAGAGTQAPVSMPVTFEPNRGQTDKQVKFLARGGPSALWLTEQGPVLSAGAGAQSVIYRMRFEGGKRHPKIEAEDSRAGVSNYLTGSDPAKWQVDVPHFGKVRYRDVYPGIDAVFYGNANDLEYDFVVSPGADPSKIRVVFDGIDAMSIDESGDLVLSTKRGEIRNRKPVIRQDGAAIEGNFVLRGARSAGFAMGNYDASRPLVIDPVFVYGTLIGGSVGDHIQGVAIDGQGMIYAAGQTWSTNFPLQNPLFTTGANGSQFVGGLAPSIFIAKFNPSASGSASLVYSTYIAGSLPAQGYAIAADAAGDVVVTGLADSPPGDGFPLVNAFQATFPDSVSCLDGSSSATGNCPSAFVLKLAASGKSLIYSSYLGGGLWDQGNAIAMDAAGNAYVVGYTQSFDFPVQGIGGNAPFQNELRQSQNGFLTVVSSTGALLYSTYFGGGEATTLNGVAVDSSGLIYVAGTTDYNQMPVTPGAYQNSFVGTLDAVAAVFNLSPNASSPVQYCTYLGGPASAAGDDGKSGGLAVATDNKGDIFVSGATVSDKFPTTPNAYSPTQELYTGFISKLNPSLSGNAQLVYSTYFDAGSFDETDGIQAIAVDTSGKITIVGSSDGFFLPVTPDAFECCYVADDFGNFGYLARFDPTQSGNSSLLYATYIGGLISTQLNSLAQDPAGKSVVLGGYVFGTAPVTPSAFQSAYTSKNISNNASEVGNGYLVVFNMSVEGPVISAVENAGGLSQLPNANLSPGLLFQVKGTGLGPATPATTEIGTNGLVTTTNSGVEVLVNGVPAPLVYVSSTAINAVAPYELAPLVGDTVYVQVSYNGALGNLFTANVAATAPGIINFDDGSGQAAVVNPDGTINGASNPAAIGSTIAIYATGEGQLNPPGVDGEVANNFNALPKPVAPVSLTIGGIPATIIYAGTAPTAVEGVFQVNATIPAGVTPGSSVPILLTVGGVASQKTATIAVSAQ
jgi:uncharacterized protein (TIGR03437 family)